MLDSACVSTPQSESRGLRVNAEVLPLRCTPGAPFELDCCIAAPTLYYLPARKARQGIETWRQLRGCYCACRCVLPPTQVHVQKQEDSCGKVCL